MEKFGQWRVRYPSMELSTLSRTFPLWPSMTQEMCILRNPTRIECYDVLQTEPCRLSLEPESRAFWGMADLQLLRNCTSPTAWHWMKGATSISAILETFEYGRLT